MTAGRKTKKESGKRTKIKNVIAQINQIIAEAEAQEIAFVDVIERAHPRYRKSLANLVHYRALRNRDLRDIQKQLGYLGLSRLAKSQSHVMASLLTSRAILQAILTKQPIQVDGAELSIKKASEQLKSNAKKLLGYRSQGRRARIMVTMPTEAAHNPQMALDMIEAGMNCARINCAHDDPTIWKKIIDHVRTASKELGKNCKVAMDLAGPKIRTGAIESGPKIQKIRPEKNLYGQVTKPLEIWVGPVEKPDLIQLPISKEDCLHLTNTEVLYFRDARGKKRKIHLVEKQEGGYLAHCWQTTFLETGMELRLDTKESEINIRVGEYPPLEMALDLRKGDFLRLDKDADMLGQPAVLNESGAIDMPAHVSCTAPEIFDEVQVGERILFDDGKIEGVIREVETAYLLIEVVHAAGGRARLRADKGINLPDSLLSIGGLTDKDKRDLPFVAEHADVVNFSFVNRPADVAELISELEQLEAKDKLGLILKIETQNGFNQLTEIMMEAMQLYPVGVMIARGDLAVETGWNNIGRVQEEILSLCQAAHLTDIWATQVLESLAKRGIPSRAEITDAVMAQRADCVMLNKGPYILDAIRLLDTILCDMEPYRDKNAPLSPMMEKASLDRKKS